MANLYEKFTKIRDKNNSILVLGLDPKNELEMQRVKQLAEIKENLIGFKPNLKFYQGKNGWYD